MSSNSGEGKRASSRVLPREVAAGVHWVGACLILDYGAEIVHVHASAYLVLGTERALLVDTGHPAHWPVVERQLDSVLEGRVLDYIFPTHGELPHAGSLERLVAKYPGVIVVGDVRDYHLLQPNITPQLRAHIAGDQIDLGGGVRFTFMPALIRDLPTTLWGFAEPGRVLFVSDGFSFTHHAALAEASDAIHLPGECALLSEELPWDPDLKQAAFLNERALYWTRYVDVGPMFDEIVTMLEATSTRLIAPAHGNPVTDVGRILPIIREVHRLAFKS